MLAEWLPLLAEVDGTAGYLFGGIALVLGAAASAYSVIHKSRRESKADGDKAEAEGRALAAEEARRNVDWMMRHYQEEVQRIAARLDEHHEEAEGQLNALHASYQVKLDAATKLHAECERNVARLEATAAMQQERITMLEKQ